MCQFQLVPASLEQVLPANGGGFVRDVTVSLPEEATGIHVHPEKLLVERGTTITELAERVGVAVVNLSVLKNGRARAIRFSTPAALCREPGCRPGDLIDHDTG